MKDAFIARDIIGIMPRGKRFVDLFAGGCTMCIVLFKKGNGKYEN